jgi:hypothetical protein
MDGTTELLDAEGAVVVPVMAQANSGRTRATVGKGRKPTPKEAPDTWPTARTIRLSTIAQVGNEVARVYRGMARGTLDPNAGTKLCYVLGVLGKTLESSQLEARIARLEQAAQQPTLTYDEPEGDRDGDQLDPEN